VRLVPGDGLIFNTLGVAQYRTGRYADVLATLTQAEKLNDAKGGLQSADLAFLAMAQHQLGKKDDAQATLGRLRELVKLPRWSIAAEAQSFLREAEELIEGKPPAPPDTFVYVAVAAEKRIAVYQLDLEQGTLTHRSDLQLEDGEPGALTVDPARRFLFA